ncbi:acylneuraminate cytidylyltransferase [Pontibacter qinzhouensis]|uniref:Acylneuraminate cytidylyltransferase n=1 Tax=Pontibacter qinzhouensis TaxID=2603253 RepID=A0A5C8K821_9BACT|nr:glycosyltransferase family protein [Pontibacter qinzhouensis]TXK44876.1 acylneuraminate cytidylyltransferase [Pontibacter qinzhouensis]
MVGKKIGVITQARMTSTRLPGKVLLTAGNKTMLQHQTDRLQQAGLPVYIATTTNTTDDAIATFAHQQAIPCYRGDEHHVLSRFYECALEHKLEVIVRVTSDCPLLDGNVIADALQQYLALADDMVYLSNALIRTYPRGFDFEIFSFKLLHTAYHAATYTADIEHVTPYINQQKIPGTKIVHYQRTSDASKYRLTLDNPEDLELLRKLIEDYKTDRLPAEEIIAIMAANPALHAINAHVEQKKLEE